MPFHCEDNFYSHTREKTKKGGKPIEIPVTDIAYAAGIVDGEGCIGLEKCNGRPNRRGYRITLYVTINNTDKPLLEWIQARWGGYIRQSKKRPERKLCWVWRACSIQAGDFLEAILPYLIIKKEEAQLGLEFQKLKRAGRPLNDDQDALQISQHLRMKELKRR